MFFRRRGQAGLSGESWGTTVAAEFCSLFYPLPPPAGGERRVRGADEPVCGAAHLTLPDAGAPRPLPLPEGRRGSLLSKAARATAALSVGVNSPDSPASHGGPGGDSRPRPHPGVAVPPVEVASSRRRDRLQAGGALALGCCCRPDGPGRSRGAASRSLLRPRASRIGMP